MLRLRALARPTSPYQSAVAIMPRSQLHRPPRRHREASRGRKSLSHNRKCHSELIRFFRSSLPVPVQQNWKFFCYWIALPLWSGRACRDEVYFFVFVIAFLATWPLTAPFIRQLPQPFWLYGLLGLIVLSIYTLLRRKYSEKWPTRMDKAMAAAEERWERKEAQHSEAPIPE